MEKDEAWGALADATRRRLLDRLARSPATTSALCQGMEISRFGVMKHLGILEEAALVTSRKVGRERYYYLSHKALLRILDHSGSRWVAGWIAAARRIEKRLDEQVEVSKPEEERTVDVRCIEVALDLPIRAKTERVWEALVAEPHLWWPRDFLAGPKGSVLRLDARAGGSLVETGGNGFELEWYRVQTVDPGKALDLNGHLAARYGGPAITSLYLQLEPAGRETMLKVTDSLFGRVSESMGSSVKEGWTAILGGLAQHCQGRK